MIAIKGKVWRIYHEGDMVVEDPSPNPEALLQGMLNLMLPVPPTRYHSMMALVTELVSTGYLARMGELGVYVLRSDRDERVNKLIERWCTWFENEWLKSGLKLEYHQASGWYIVVREEATDE